MPELFFSLSSDKLFITVLKENKCLASVLKENKRLHSENFFFYLKQVLEESKVSLKEIKEIFFTSSAGGQTGLRISLTFALTCQTINPLIRLCHLNSLFFQSGKNNAISLLTIDNKGRKYHMAVYKEKKCLIEPQIINQEKLELLKNQFFSLPVFSDFSQVDFLHNFQYLKEHFQEIKNLEEINF